MSNWGKAEHPAFGVYEATPATRTSGSVVPHLVDAQGRMTVTGTVTASPVVATAGVQNTISVGVASALALAADANCKSLVFENLGTVPIYLSNNSPAVVASSLQLPVGGILSMDPASGATLAWYAISTVAAQDLRYSKWT